MSETTQTEQNSNTNCPSESKEGMLQEALENDENMEFYLTGTDAKEIRKDILNLTQGTTKDPQPKWEFEDEEHRREGLRYGLFGSSAEMAWYLEHSSPEEVRADILNKIESEVNEATNGIRKMTSKDQITWVGQVNHSKLPHDDWGFIRDEAHNLIAKVLCPISITDENKAEFIKTGIDPTEARTKEIVRRLNQTVEPQLQRTVFDDYVIQAMKAYLNSSHQSSRTELDAMLPWAIELAKEAMKARKGFLDEQK